MEVKKKKMLAFFTMCMIVIIAALIFYLWETRLSEYLKEPEILRGFVEQKGFLAQIIFIGVIVMQVIIAIIPGEPFEVAAGYAFGAIEGTILSLIGTVLGGIIVFLLVRTFGIKFVRLFYSQEKIDSLSFLKTSRKKTILYFLIFMIPGTPKDLLSYFVGITDMKLSLWILISFFGRIPSLITSTLSGNFLGTGNYLKAIVMFTVTSILCITGIIIFYKISERGKKVDDN